MKKRTGENREKLIGTTEKVKRGRSFEKNKEM